MACVELQTSDDGEIVVWLSLEEEIWALFSWDGEQNDNDRSGLRRMWTRLGSPPEEANPCLPTENYFVVCFKDDIIKLLLQHSKASSFYISTAADAEIKNIPIIVIGTPAYSSDCRNKSAQSLLRVCEPLFSCWWISCPCPCLSPALHLKSFNEGTSTRISQYPNTSFYVLLSSVSLHVLLNCESRFTVQCFLSGISHEKGGVEVGVGWRLTPISVT